MQVSGLGACDLVPFSENDVAELCELEKVLNHSPWSESNFMHSIRAGHMCLVLKHGDQCQAYAVCSQVLDEAELLLIGVNKSCQRKGLGKLLLQEICLILESKANTLFLEVRESNEAAIALYESMNFNCLGSRPAYYPTPKGREDALLFALDLKNN